ncbi:hypothetical protein [Evansella tamaricis]|uniref:Hydrolase n=1 Tax=Evansella tamaricis TaxID=2069301 RepID=A0ABS6JHU7_9BACI|nr:hypothetical protein [Evansella tamaricis]MBU9713254.1 hypothetical protein [Evansella tamaricis]
MSVRKRTLTIEEEKCLLHLPEKPNGYGILLVGDRNHYIQGETSLWTQHPTRKNLLEGLMEAGYTIFYCDQGGAHWGNDRLSVVLGRLKSLVMKTEILNQHIHILAEGMGALLVLRLMTDPSVSVRSAVFINPCFYLDKQLEEEKTNRFFYKKMIQEIKSSYGIEEKEIEDVCKKLGEICEKLDPSIPIRLIQAVYQAPYSMEKQTRFFIKEKKQTQKDLETTFYLPGKTIEQFLQPILTFFVKYE